MQRDQWLEEVRQALLSINMPLAEWNERYPFDFDHCFRLGMSSTATAMAANHFWWRKSDDILRGLGIVPDLIDPME